MGYSITIRCRSKQLKTKMLIFLEKNFRDTKKLFGVECYSIITDNLSFDQNRTAIGFDYQPCSELVLFYLMIIIRWMAIKIGKKDDFGKHGTIPFYLCDGYQKNPIITKENELGFKSFSSGYNEKERKALEISNKLAMKEIDRIILRELKRLDKAWEKFLIKEQKKKDATPNTKPRST